MSQDLVKILIKQARDRRDSSGQDPLIQVKPKKTLKTFTRGPYLLEGERRLMLSVLEQAVDECRKYSGAGGSRARARFLETVAWFASTDSGWPYSFEAICETFDLDPSSIRRSLKIKEPKA